MNALPFDYALDFRFNLKTAVQATEVTENTEKEKVPQSFAGAPERRIATL
jgi:hypothetical protein